MATWTTPDSVIVPRYIPGEWKVMAAVPRKFRAIASP